MAAGAVGSVQNWSRHQNGDTHVADFDDVFSDAGSTPAASTKFLKEIEKSASISCRLQTVSTPNPRLIEQSDRVLDDRRTDVHVSLRRRQLLMPGERLDGPCG